VRHSFLILGTIDGYGSCSRGARLSQDDFVYLSGRLLNGLHPDIRPVSIIHREERSAVALEVEADLTESCVQLFISSIVCEKHRYLPQRYVLSKVERSHQTP
jgi:hypothetical protein